MITLNSYFYSQTQNDSGKTGTTPLTEEEWENLQPIIEKLKGKLEIKGITENLWRTL